ncbi:unnamed protein product [Meloidogyne enterolobii]|uniref:Uncharacterized protein n=1 Tax=Meloidogyne enterolobii TaxID=390850 RepID=A0ACB0XW90_MELEN
MSVEINFTLNMPFPNKITPSDILLVSENDEDINNNTSAIFKFYPSNNLPFSERNKEEKSKKSFNEIEKEETKQRDEEEENYLFNNKTLKPKIQIKKIQKQNSDPIPASHRIETSISEKNKTKGSIKRILIPTPWRNILLKELLEKAKNDFKYNWENVKTVRYF